MSIKLDLNLLPIYRREGQPQQYLPGVHVSAPPRRAARGRKNDHLVIYLNVDGDLRLGRDQQIKLLEGAAKTFYNTSGSVTAAFRTVTEALNDVILRRNLHGGQPVTAYLSLAVLREEKLYLAQSGAAHGFLFAGGGLEYFHDEDAAGRGLGTGRTPEIKFFQIDLSHGAIFLIVPHVPATWDQTTIQAAAGQPLYVAARRFYEDARTDLKAVILEARSGRGLINVLQTNSGIGAPASSQQPASPQKPASAQQPPAQPPLTRPVQQARPSRAEPSIPGEDTQSQPDVGPVQRLRERTAQALNAVRPQRQTIEKPTGDMPQSPAEEENIVEETPDVRQARLSEKHKASSRNFGKKIGDSLLNMLRGLGRVFARMLPDEEALRIPAWVMAAIAIGVPLVLGAIALVMYINVGREQLYDIYYQQAVVAAEVAAEKGTGPETRITWKEVLLLVDKTELYGETEETQALRSQTQSILDNMDGIQRLIFEDAISGLLSPVVQIEEMVVVNDDLYMLDINSGTVFRAWKTGTGNMQIDSDFHNNCGPGQYNGLIVGPLVDIAALSKLNKLGAAVVAMDANGNLVFCGADGSLTAMQLKPPDNNWGEPQAMALDGGNLFILDPKTNAVWVYTGDGESFSGDPRFFFAAEVPSLKSVVDMVVNGSDLFLLHEDGVLTHCVFNNLQAAPTTCSEAVFDIGEMEADGESPLSGIHFAELSRRLPPDPALFFLEPTTQSLYMFGIRLHFERQFRAGDLLTVGEATSFAISESRAIYIAIGHEVFRSTLP